MKVEWDLTDIEKVFLYRCIVNRLSLEVVTKLFKQEELDVMEFQINKILNNTSSKEIDNGLVKLATKVGQLIQDQIADETRKTLN